MRLLAPCSGIEPLLIKEILGHSPVSFTLSIYAHLMPGAHRRAAAAMEEVLSALQPQPAAPPGPGRGGGKGKHEPKSLHALISPADWPTLLEPCGVDGAAALSRQASDAPNRPGVLCTTLSDRLICGPAAGITFMIPRTSMPAITRHLS